MLNVHKQYPRSKNFSYSSLFLFFIILLQINFSLFKILRCQGKITPAFARMRNFTSVSRAEDSLVTSTVSYVTKGYIQVNLSFSIIIKNINIICTTSSDFKWKAQIHCHFLSLIIIIFAIASLVCCFDWLVMNRRTN